LHSNLYPFRISGLVNADNFNLYRYGCSASIMNKVCVIIFTYIHSVSFWHVEDISKDSWVEVEVNKLLASLQLYDFFFYKKNNKLNHKIRISYLKQTEFFFKLSWKNSSNLIYKNNICHLHTRNAYFLFEVGDQFTCIEFEIGMVWDLRKHKILSWVKREFQSHWWWYGKGGTMGSTCVLNLLISSILSHRHLPWIGFFHFFFISVFLVARSPSYRGSQQGRCRWCISSGTCPFIIYCFSQFKPYLTPLFIYFSLFIYFFLFFFIFFRWTEKERDKESY